MLERGKAMELARDFLRQQDWDAGMEIEITTSDYIPEKGCLIVRYDSVKHLNTGDPMDALVGGVPVKVDLRNSTVAYISWDEEDHILGR